LVVLTLPAGATVGSRAVGADGKVDEAGSVGEVSNTCGAGQKQARDSPQDSNLRSRLRRAIFAILKIVDKCL
jgi:hypothetical protein